LTRKVKRKEEHTKDIFSRIDTLDDYSLLLANLTQAVRAFFKLIITHNVPVLLPRLCDSENLELGVVVVLAGLGQSFERDIAWEVEASERRRKTMQEG